MAKCSKCKKEHALVKNKHHHYKHLCGACYGDVFSSGLVLGLVRMLEIGYISCK